MGTADQRDVDAADLPHTPRRLLQCRCSWLPTGCSCRLLQGAYRRQQGLLPPGPVLPRGSSIEQCESLKRQFRRRLDAGTRQGVGSPSARFLHRSNTLPDRVTCCTLQQFGRRSNTRSGSPKAERSKSAGTARMGVPQGGLTDNKATSRLLDVQRLLYLPTNAPNTPSAWGQRDLPGGWGPEAASPACSASQRDASSARCNTRLKEKVPCCHSILG